MKKNFYAFLDDFNLITIIVPHRYRHDRITRFILRSVNMEQELEITSVIKLDSDIKYCCKVQGLIDLRKDYFVVDDLGYQNHLQVGRITKTKQFDDMFYFDGRLGFEYSPDHTTFRLWTPVAKEVILEIIDTENIKRYVDLSYTNHGVWETCVLDNLDKTRYRYLIRINNDFKITLDPYAISSTANAKYNYVIDLDKAFQFKHVAPFFSGKAVDAIIYEAHIRDLTIDRTSGTIRKGKYLGVLENSFSPEGNSTGVNYIQELGITHVQLLPFNDFDAVDEHNTDAFYNWGYNPEQYNVPEGWFASNPDDPYTRINELKMLIDGFHAKGIRVNMDVVFNHVYDVGTFPFEKLVPNYYFRLEKNGNLSNSSGCGNDLATEMRMVRKFIIDSVLFWQKHYQIAGFRFDLMGLIDVETMNEVVDKTKASDPSILIYGEGWNIPSVYPSSQLSHIHNHHKLPDIAFFNDRFRDTIKGSTFGIKSGFALGNSEEEGDVKQLLLGSAVDHFMFDSPNQSVNYVECHDNHTFYDKASIILRSAEEEVKKEFQKLGISLVLISQGAAFLHAGQEFMRSKEQIENSYRSSDEINKINWFQRDVHSDIVQMTKDLISIRKEFRHFRLQHSNEIKQSTKFISTEDSSILTYMISVDGRRIQVVIKNNFKETNLFGILQGNKLCFFDGNKKRSTPVTLHYINTPGVYLFE